MVASEMMPIKQCFSYVSNSVLTQITISGQKGTIEFQTLIVKPQANDVSADNALSHHGLISKKAGNMIKSMYP